MASNAAAPFWRAAGMTYITYSNICANLVRNCLKEPYKTEALSREKVHFAVTKFVDGNPQKPDLGFLDSVPMMFVSPDFIESDLVLFKFVIIVNHHLNDDEEVID
ncbi:hypothetical protein POTOM_039072 [Populus tomentosa]|uniref:ATP synthase subunit epsilon, mitochondrial n=1 Tax=Populus tomentosa TaxID=118781 RepID=A0A8X7YTM0_POPTO|nr:hypothetical protein POTOM_039072 [Populus tomentosa]